jgi:hypothetical protein
VYPLKGISLSTAGNLYGSQLEKQEKHVVAKQDGYRMEASAPHVRFTNLSEMLFLFLWKNRSTIVDKS